MTKQSIVKLIIEAHRKSLMTAEEAVLRFKDSKTFPGVSEREAEKVIKLKQSLNTLEGTSLDKLGPIYVVSNSHYGIRYYYIVDSEDFELAAWELSNATTEVFMIQQKELGLEKVGQVIKYLQGRPGEEFEVEVKLLQIL
jgi:hypothetical protein